MPGIIDFLKAMGFPVLTTNAMLKAMKTIQCSDQTCIAVLVKAINESRTGIAANTQKDIRSAILFKTKEGLKSVDQIQPTEQIDSVFEGAITEKLASCADYSSFMRRIGLDETHLTFNRSKCISTPSAGAQEQSTTLTLERPLVVHAWRTAELNCLEILKALESVVHIVDVSKQNMGYDLEATMKDGSKAYFEVKNVSKFGDPVLISNNEYSTGTHYRSQYYLAIICQSETDINVCLIQDPINQLLLDKRVTRWDWVCEQYSGKILKAKIK